jgi:hypothetical protein
MVGGSFRLVAKVGVPLGAVLILAACGGSTKPEPVSTRVVAGPGFTFSLPQGFTVRKTDQAVVAKQGREVVSATRFPLLKPYDPARFGAVTKELDGVAAELASRAGGKVVERATVTVDGGKIRVYRFTAKGSPTRIGFVLVDKTEYQLACSGRIGPACELLFSSFTTA